MCHFIYTRLIVNTKLCFCATVHHFITKISVSQESINYLLKVFNSVVKCKGKYMFDVDKTEHNNKTKRFVNGKIVCVI